MHGTIRDSPQHRPQDFENPHVAGQAINYVAFDPS